MLALDAMALTVARPAFGEATLVLGATSQRCSAPIGTDRSNTWSQAIPKTRG